MLLARQVLVFGYAGKVLGLGVVDDGHRLKLLLVEGYVLEAQRAVRKPAESPVEEFVYRPGVDHPQKRYFAQHVPVVGLEHDIYIGMVQHPLKHARIAAGGHTLEFVAKVSIVPVGPGRYTSGYRFAQL